MIDVHTTQTRGAITMNKQHLITCLIACTLLGTTLRASAQDAPEVVVYDRERGELSVGTGAPTRERMVNAIKSASPTALYAMLEYGERVECFECIPLLEKKLLGSENAQTREIAAWWLRRRSFGFGPIMVRMRTAAAEHAEPVMRARALAALGEFLDPHALPTLVKSATSDSEASVRVAAVRALGRLNASAGNATLSMAMADPDAAVRMAALSQVLKVGFFRDSAALIARLDDSDAGVRRAGAQLSGELRIVDAVEPLAGLLVTDDSAQVRQAAAIALGRIGGSEALAALSDALKLEKDDSVSGAIEIARRMRSAR
jgi:HEAT repeat protein